MSKYKDILVVNALNGVFALSLRKKYPEARITCAEFFTHCHGHLRRLGFDVVEYDKKKEELVNFDVVVANPPYQDPINKAKNNKLWHKFVREVKGMAAPDGVIAFVTPSSIFNRSVGFGKWFSEEFMPGNSLVAADIHRDVNHFNVGVETCHWVVKLGESDNRVDYPEFRDPIIDRIVDKVNSYPKKMTLLQENPHITREHFDNGSTEIFYSGKNTTTVDVTVENNGKLKIVFPFSASYHSQFVTRGNTAHFNRVLYVKNKTEANNILSYTLSKLFRFYAAHYQKTSGFTPAVKNSQLPLLDSTKLWTEQAVYDEFGLTEKEIAYVEGQVK